MGNPLIIIAIFLLMLVSISMFILAFAKPKQKEDIAARLEKIKSNQDFAIVDKDKDKKTSALQKELFKVIKNLEPISNKLVSEKLRKSYQARLVKAGKYDTTVEMFTSMRILTAIVLPVLFLLVGYLVLEMSIEDALMYSPVVVIAGYILPVARLNRQVDDRHRAIFRNLPDMLDLLTICLESGMGINEAMNKVVEKSNPSPLIDELDRTLKEIQLGKPRLQGLRDMAKRIDLRELSSVIISIVQAEQMGTSLAKTLKVQSEIIRDIRWQKAQEMAQKAPIKMIIPIALFIFPTIFIIIFGPLVISFMINNQ